MKRRTVIFGATSAIAQETARLLSVEGDRLFLVSRNREKLEGVASDLESQGTELAGTGSFEARDFENHAEVVEQAFQALGGADLAIIAHGDLPDQDACQESFPVCRQAFETNALSVFSLLTLLSARFKAAGEGTLLVVSSVAGDRGRRSNYVYGAAKGSVSLFTQGLRSHLHSHGIRVITVKPGPVVTPMTSHLKKGFLWTTPQKAARGILKAINGSRDVVFVPWFWRWIMATIGMIPERLFKRLDF